MLGAALAPTDATAVGVLARDLPRRTVTVLRAESLVNDGTALVLYGLAVGVTVGEEQLTGWHVTWLLVLAYGGGVLAGALIGLLSWQVRRRMDDPMLESHRDAGDPVRRVPAGRRRSTPPACWPSSSAGCS